MSTSSASAAPPGIPPGRNDVALAARGKRRIEWAFQSMNVLQSIRKHFIKTQPFAALRVAASVRLTPETANLLVTLRDGGAQVGLYPAQTLAAEDEVAASLVKDYGITLYGAVSEAGALAERPQLVLDENCQLSNLLHAEPPDPAENIIIGAVEQSTSGAYNLRRLAREGSLRYPVIALNESQTIRLSEHRYGSGQSVIEAVVRYGNVLLAGLNVVVLGYGARGSGVALRARGFGANIIVTETDPVRAFNAVLDGHRVLSIAEAASLGDVFVTATGGKNVISREHFEKFKNGVIVCNAGHSAVEIDLETLGHISSSHRPSRDAVEEFILRDGRRIYLLADGQDIHAVAAGAIPSSVLDISCANQALSAEYLVKSVAAFDKSKGASSLGKIVYALPAALDRQVAKMKLESMGINIDRLTVEQEHYLANWPDGA